MGLMLSRPDCYMPDCSPWTYEEVPNRCVIAAGMA